MKFQIVAKAECGLYRAPAMFAAAGTNRFRKKADNAQGGFRWVPKCAISHIVLARAVILATLSAQLIWILHCSGDLQGTLRAESNR
jgi:hypothetical protein